MIVFMTTRNTLLEFQVTFRRSARAAESARLESVCGETHRGFESHLLRAKILFYGIFKFNYPIGSCHFPFYLRTIYCS